MHGRGRGKRGEVCAGPGAVWQGRDNRIPIIGPVQALVATLEEKKLGGCSTENGASGALSAGATQWMRVTRVLQRHGAEMSAPCHETQLYIRVQEGCQL
ncbi:hypothetical protein THIX_60191 [Thiomonas sp. X19]|nr:hypothetical protein THIX_60191 [Thiomonas sp. X19]